MFIGEGQPNFHPVPRHHPYTSIGCAKARPWNTLMKNKTKTNGAKQQAANLTLRMRAECATDAQVVRALFLPWLVMWQESQMPTRHEGRTHLLPGTEVTFTLTNTGPTHGEAVWLIDHLLNCHVIAETLMPAARYTGERKSRRRFAAPAKQPSPEVVEQAVAALERRLTTLAMEDRRAAFSAEQLKHCNTSPLASTVLASENEPGWVFIVEHEATDFASVHAARAMSQDLDELVCGRPHPEARAFTLAS